MQERNQCRCLRWARDHCHYQLTRRWTWSTIMHRPMMLCSWQVGCLMTVVFNIWWSFPACRSKRRDVLSFLLLVAIHLADSMVINEMILGLQWGHYLCETLFVCLLFSALEKQSLKVAQTSDPANPSNNETIPDPVISVLSVQFKYIISKINYNPLN